MNNFYRGRRLRQSPAIRRLVRETRLSVDSFVYPLFVVPGTGIKEAILSMPGQYRWSVDCVVDECRRAADLGIPAVLLFGIPEVKDAVGSEASSPDGTVQRACAAIKKALPELCIITDVCLCEYTDHGHCGLPDENQYIQNDATLERLAQTAISHVRAGADIIAPSDMMDGRVQYIRQALDGAGYIDTPIMSYSAKYASAFYGPFRDAAGSTPQFGDRRTYQMDPANRREALREVLADISEGADIVMVKPALPYLDIIRDVRESCNLPIAAYQVSGEYSMIKAAAEKGWIDEPRAVIETLTSIKRAGADIIISYYALDVAGWMGEG
ncbi:MAG: porphobilinogen synthase [bacterium]